MAELSSNHDIKIIISSILPVYKYPWAEHISNVPDTIESLNQKIKKFTKTHNIPYIDYYSAMVDEKRGLKNEYTTDGVHLNKTGYGVMSKMVHSLLKNEGLTI